MEQLSFNDVIERIASKLPEVDDDVLTGIYNQIFDSPITYVGGDLWEEEVDDNDIVVDDDIDEDDDLDKPIKRKGSVYDKYDNDDIYTAFPDDDDE